MMKQRRCSSTGGSTSARQRLRCAPCVVAHPLVLLLLLSLSANTVVHGYSDGAGDCPAGRPAIGDAHTDSTAADRPVTQLSLEEAGLRLTINDFDLVNYYATTVGANNGGVEAEEIQIRLQGDYEVAVEAVAASGENHQRPFKGALIRVQQHPSSSGSSSLQSREGGTAVAAEILTLVAGRNARMAVACGAGATGVTHTDAAEKTVLSGFFRTSSVETVAIDVTVVLWNNSTGSVYAYQAFEVGVASPHLSPAPTSAPFDDAITTNNVDDNSVNNDDNPAPAPTATASTPTNQGPLSEPVLEFGGDGSTTTASSGVITRCTTFLLGRSGFWLLVLLYRLAWSA